MLYSLKVSVCLNFASPETTCSISKNDDQKINTTSRKAKIINSQEELFRSPISVEKNKIGIFKYFSLFPVLLDFETFLALINF